MNRLLFQRAWIRVATVLAWVSAWLMLASAGAAQSRAEVSVHVNAPPTAYLGDQFELQVIVRNARQVERPQPPPSPDYDIQDTGGTTTSTTIVNGYMSQMFGYKLSVTPRRVGEITIAPFEVVADGRSYQTKPVTVKVVEPSTSPDFQLEIVPEKTRAYVGEPIRLRGVLTLGKRIKTLAFVTPQLPAGLEMLEPIDPRPPGVHPQDPRYIRLSLGGETVIATVTAGNAAAGTRQDQLRFDRIIVPRQAGRLRVDATIARFDAVIGQRAPRFTDGPFADLDVTSRQMAVSEPYQIDVLPLPTQGRPADFSGLVGGYSVTSTADPREAAVGEPITLRVTVNGPPPLSLIPLLDLTRQPGLVSGFRVPREPVLPAMTPVGAMFTYPIRARKAGEQQIPPIELSYFDTAAGEYRIARSEPIRINIRATPGVEIDQLDDLADSADGIAADARPDSRIDTTALALTGDRFDLAAAARRPSTWALLAGSPAVFVGVLAGQRVRQRALADPAGRRRRRAIKAAHRRLRGAAASADRVAAAGAVASVLTNLAADWFDRPADSLTSRQALEMLAGQSDPFAGELSSLLYECDRIRFAPAGAAASEPQSLVARTRELLGRLASSLAARKEQPCT